MQKYMFDVVFHHYKDYDFWLQNSHKYSIVHVLEFCGSEKFVIEASLALPRYNDTRPNYADEAATRTFFVQNFRGLPYEYRDAILRNGHLSETFFLRIVDHIDWNNMVENFGVSLDFFKNYRNKFNVWVCARSNIRKDVFDLFDRAEVIKKLNTTQKLRSPHFDERTELFPLGPKCKTDEEKTAYVNRIILGNMKAPQPVWVQGTASQFWYTYFIYNPKLCSVFCDNRQFLEANVKHFNWDFMCLNPSVDVAFLKRRIGDINRSNILLSHTADSLVEIFEDSYSKNDLFKWFMGIKFPAEVDEFHKRYLGNKSIYNPEGRKLAEPIAPPREIKFSDANEQLREYQENLIVDTGTDLDMLF